MILIIFTYFASECLIKILRMKRLSAEALYDRLVNQEKIIGKSGNIKFILNGLDVKIKSKDSVGNLLQEWLKEWLNKEDIEHLENPNRQAFPDFFLNLENNKDNLLEVKTFDWDRGPGFDLANFDSYCNSLLTNAYRLDSNYLVFAYKMSVDGEIIIHNVWLKKIWELAGGSGTYPIKVQEKKETIYNLRPVTWFSERAPFKCFNSKEEFLKALNETRYQYSKTRAQNNHWLNKVTANYKLHTGTDLIVPSR